jgi:hypothetical protein
MSQTQKMNLLMNLFNFGGSAPVKPAMRRPPSGKAKMQRALTSHRSMTASARLLILAALETELVTQH